MADRLEIVDGLEVVAGVEGYCVYLNGYRIAGPKPWGGGESIGKYAVDREDIEHAMERAAPNVPPESMKEKT